MLSFADGKKLLESGDNSDLTFVCGDLRLHAHKEVVCPQSPYIRELCDVTVFIDQSATFRINKEHDMLLKLLEILYMGNYSDAVEGTPRMSDPIISTDLDQFRTMLKTEIRSTEGRYNLNSLQDLNEVGHERVLESLEQAVKIHDVAVKFQVPGAKLLCQARFCRAAMKLILLAKGRSLDEPHVHEFHPTFHIWERLSSILLNVVETDWGNGGMTFWVQQLISYCFHHYKEFWVFMKDETAFHCFLANYAVMQPAYADADEQAGQ